MKPGVYKAECVLGNYKAELAHDVVFVGGGLEYMHPEWPYRRQLVRWLVDKYSGNLTFDPVYGPVVPRFAVAGLNVAPAWSPCR